MTPEQPNSPNSDDVPRWVDALYSEDPNSADALSAEDRELLIEYQGLREILRELPEQEPPASVSAKLLAFAAKPMKRPRGGGVFGWLAGVFSPIVMHPGLAAAASLTLVVGIAGSLYYRGVTETHDLVPSREAVSPTTTAPTESDSPAPTSEAMAEEQPRGERGAGPAAMDDDLARLSDGFSEGPGTKTNSTGTGAAKSKVDRRSEQWKISAKRKSKKRTQKKQAQRALSNRGKPTKSTKSKSTAGTTAFGGTLSTDSEDDETTRRDRKERTLEDSAPEQKTTEKPRQVEPSKSPVVSASPPPKQSERRGNVKRDRLHSLASKRAAAGDCAGWAKLAGQLRKIDADYYATVHIRQPAVRKCLAAYKKK